MNLVLSFAFSAVVVWGFSVINVAPFDWTNVALATVFLMVATYLLVLR